MIHTPHIEPPIQVMLVDDSAVIRGLIARELEKHPGIDIVATANDGEMAISIIKRQAVDIILLDIEMPKKNGLEALPILRNLAPDAYVIMVSTLTTRNAEITLQALELGAIDTVAKPSTHSGEGLEAFYRELTEKVIALGLAKRQGNAGGELTKSDHPTSGPTERLAPQTEKAPTPMQLSKASVRAHAIVIAASTGGPQALACWLKAASASIVQVPVLIVQHMPSTFTGLLAQHLAKDSSLPCKEAETDELILPGTVYIAPGDYHMRIGGELQSPRIVLSQDPPINFCRPSADPLFISAAERYGRHLLGLVLTGMGSDGRAGAEAVKKAGGTVLVQDQQSSVVWGMPGAVVAAQQYDAIYSLEEMAEAAGRLVQS